MKTNKGTTKLNSKVYTNERIALNDHIIHVLCECLSLISARTLHAHMLCS